MNFTHSLIYLCKDNHICLGQKKRGLGAGYWNGFGGKIEPGETAEQSAVRELYEESGVKVSIDDIEQRAAIDFYFVDGLHVKGAVFVAKTWKGEPAETEEMTPQWFAYNEVPYHQMWPIDKAWVPNVLAGEKIIGEVYFTEAVDGALKTNFTVVDSF